MGGSRTELSELPDTLDLGSFGGNGGKRGPDDGGKGFRPRVERFGLPDIRQHVVLQGSR
jgi:hypothetical protein